MLRSLGNLCAPRSSVSSASGHCSPCSSDRRDADDEDSELVINQAVPDKTAEFISKTSFEIVFESASSSSDEESSPPEAIITRLPSIPSTQRLQRREATKKVLSYAENENENKDLSVCDSKSVVSNSSESVKTNDSQATTRLSNRISETMSTKGVKTPFECSECRRRFTCQSSLNRHKKEHEAEFMCRDCGKCCQSNRVLIDHQRTHTGERPFKCRVKGCGRSYTSEYCLKKHQPAHTDKYKCPDCKKRCHSKYALQEHRQSHVGGHFQCTVNGCNCSFRTIRSLSQHVQAFHDQKQFNNEKSFMCLFDGCGRRFASRVGLKRHTNEHEARFRCGDCGRCCSSNARLKEHQQTVHSITYTSKYSRGSRCTKSASPKKHQQLLKLKGREKQSKVKKLPINRKAKEKAIESMRQHQDDDSSSENSSIDSNEMTSIRGHINLTPNDQVERNAKLKPNKNDANKTNLSKLLPDKTVNNKSILPFPKRTAKKLFECDIPGCDRIFGSPTGLYFHKNMHTNNFRCPDCGKRCQSKFNLEVHQRLHTGEKPYACKKHKCEERFRWGYQLKQHCEMQHRKNIKCPTCEKSFQCKLALKLHCVDVHSAKTKAKSGEVREPATNKQSLSTKDAIINNINHCIQTLESAVNKSPVNKEKALQSNQLENKSDLENDSVSDNDSDYSSEDSSTKDCEIKRNEKKSSEMENNEIEASEMSSNQSDISTLVLPRGPQTESVSCQVDLEKELEASLEVVLNPANKLFKCCVKGCDCRFSNLNGLYKHKKVYHRQFKCRECNRKFESGYSLHKHRRNNHCHCCRKFWVRLLLERNKKLQANSKQKEDTQLEQGKNTDENSSNDISSSESEGNLEDDSSKWVVIDLNDLPIIFEDITQNRKQSLMVEQKENSESELELNQSEDDEVTPDKEIETILKKGLLNTSSETSPFNVDINEILDNLGDIIQSSPLPSEKSPINLEKSKEAENVFDQDEDDSSCSSCCSSLCSSENSSTSLDEETSEEMPHQSDVESSPEPEFKDACCQTTISLIT